MWTIKVYDSQKVVLAHREALELLLTSLSRCGGVPNQWSWREEKDVIFNIILRKRLGPDIGSNIKFPSRIVSCAKARSPLILRWINEIHSGR
jgi:hypothetical protein